MMGACVTNKNNRIHSIPQPELLPDDCLKLIFDKLNGKTDQDSFGLTCHSFLDIQNSCRKHLDFKSNYSKNDCENHYDSPIRGRSKINCDLSPIQLFNRYNHLSSSLTSCDKLLRLFHRFNHLESLSLTNGDRLLDSSIKKLRIYLCRLHSLDLSDCSYITDKGLTSLASCCPLLSVIRLPGCKLITDKGLKFLTKFCKSLKQVDLSGCYKITDTGIGYMKENCREVRALRISGCYEILGVGFLGFSRSLVSVEAERCYMLDSGGVAAILCGGGLEYLTLPFIIHELSAIGLGGNGANIKILDVGGSVVDNDAIMNIAKGCPLLQEWNLSRCKEIDVSGWKSIGLYCQNLKTIHVTRMFCLFDDKIMALSNCRRLSVIYIYAGWAERRRSPREICDMMRKDVKIIVYKGYEVSKNTISWDDWDLQYDSKTIM